MFRLICWSALLDGRPTVTVEEIILSVCVVPWMNSQRLQCCPFSPSIVCREGLGSHGEAVQGWAGQDVYKWPKTEFTPVLRPMVWLAILVICLHKTDRWELRGYAGQKIGLAFWLSWRRLSFVPLAFCISFIIIITFYRPVFINREPEEI